MNEVTQRVIRQELWGLIAQSALADKHSFEILSRIAKVEAKEDVHEITPMKRKIVEEMELEWRFLTTIYEDLQAIAAELEIPEVVPEQPEMSFDNGLWEVDELGIFNEIYRANSEIAHFQEAMNAAVYKLQEAV